MCGDYSATVTYLADGDFHSLPYAGFRASKYRVQPVPRSRIQTLHDGDTIALGDGCNLLVMHTPGHSMGSICLYEARAKWLFSGDTLYLGAMLDWLPSSQPSLFRTSLDRLSKLDVRLVLPGHFDMLDSEQMMFLIRRYHKSSGCCGYMCCCCLYRQLVTLYFCVKASGYGCCCCC